MTQLEIGAKAPEFTAESTQGLISLPELLAGSEKGVIVYFYPKASTPGCTTQACDFRDNLNTMKAAGYTVVGVSADPIPALEKFTQKQGLNFPLISDPEHAILEPWGAWGEKKNYGRIFTGIIRSTIVVGKDGTVALAQYNVKATGHVARLRRDLGLDD
ncbi:peroxiredoxin [Schaalia turicensis]|uniref:peroxiredoxin n=1 Tax=Schaalia turicensis TaxID=131111 RepID=UPI0034A4CE7A